MTGDCLFHWKGVKISVARIVKRYQLGDMEVSALDGVDLGAETWGIDKHRRRQWMR